MERVVLTSNSFLSHYREGEDEWMGRRDQQKTSSSSAESSTLHSITVQFYINWYVIFCFAVVSCSKQSFALLQKATLQLFIFNFESHFLLLNRTCSVIDLCGSAAWDFPC